MTMCEFSTRFSRTALRVLKISVIVVLGWVVLPASHAGDPVERSAREWDAMIDSLANHNPPPQLWRFVNRTDFDSNIVPFFPVDYDWDEQARIRAALFPLAHGSSEVLWERLVKHSDDKRYALTTRSNMDDYSNWSVGRLCRMIANRRLYFVSRMHSDPKSGERPDVFFDLGIENLAKWRNDRSGKSLYELQIEVCETALKQVPQQKEISDQARHRIGEDIKMMIAKLEQTKNPFFFERSMDSYGYFNKEKAKSARAIIPRLIPTKE